MKDRIERKSTLLCWLSSGIPALVSSARFSQLAAHLREVKQFAVQFDVLVTSEQTKSYKPNRAIFDRAVELIGEHPSRTIHIAEARCEASPVRALGMQSIWVNRSQRSDDGSNAQPNAVVANLTQITEAIW
ncbi:HAD family hydrolase [Bradyrhizobium sp. BWA-3-5]|uniref:HAD family hydrolase n=1 Tax=Bradyrhizobium sp. BWA-3-5 TaxID=3080013 RepID=UPI00293ECE80|nr:HAD family hydrolase [Bradyrhizobium sp. BWA-3-5]WOH67141.1 HAD family hydrolase [Bradyrhizobium sp. BWA-3-5]